MDPRLISHSHHLDKFTLKGNFKIELGFGGINTFAISKDHLSLERDIKGMESLQKDLPTSRRQVAVVRLNLRDLQELT